METNSRTEQFYVDKFFDKYGAFLTIDQMAELFDRSKVGFSQFMRSDSEFAQKLRPARRKVGRRVLYATYDVALIVASGGQ